MEKKIVITIFLFGLFLRIYNLGNIPVGFHRDEAYLGYNAYSILKTGKDITDNFLPVHLQSFLYSPAGYSYLSIPFIAIFSLNEFSVRFASALFGSLTILLTYFLVKKVFSTPDSKHSLRMKHWERKTSIIASLLLAISPWHINLSRVATENVLVVFFIALGTLLYLNWIGSKKISLLLLSFISFGITLTIYQAPRAFLPLFIPLLFIIFHKGRILKKTNVLILVLYIMIIILPLFITLSSHNLSQRIRMLSIFHHPATQLVLEEQLREDGADANRFVTRLFHNKIINYSSTFLQNYTKHFSHEFLFTDTGLPARYRIPGMGLLYLLDIPFLLLGFIKMFSNHKKTALFLSGWILLAPIGSALTFDDIPNLQRTLIAFPAISIITAYGVTGLWLNVSSLKFGIAIKILLIIIMFYNFLFYLHQYYIHQINHQPWQRQEGYKQLVSYVNNALPQYKQVVITDAESAPEIFFLFYSSTDPNVIQNSSKNKEWKTTNLSFNKYKFDTSCPLHTDPIIDPITKLSKMVINAEENTLYVNHVICEVSDKHIQTIKEIKRSDGTTVFKIVLPK